MKEVLCGGPCRGRTDAPLMKSPGQQWGSAGTRSDAYLCWSAYRQGCRVMGSSSGVIGSSSGREVLGAPLRGGVWGEIETRAFPGIM